MTDKPEQSGEGDEPSANPQTGERRRADYEVGYGKPPKSTQFKPGKSGNPKGGRKRRLSVAEQADKALRRKIVVNEGGTPRRIAIEELTLMSLAHKAAKGDLKAATYLFELRESPSDGLSADTDPTNVTDDGRAIVADLVRQLTTGEPVEALAGGAVRNMPGPPVASESTPPAVDVSPIEVPPGGSTSAQTLDALKPTEEATNAAARSAHNVALEPEPEPAQVSDPAMPYDHAPHPAQASPPAQVRSTRPLPSATPAPSAADAAPRGAVATHGPAGVSGTITFVDPPATPAVTVIRAAPSPHCLRVKNDE